MRTKVDQPKRVLLTGPWSESGGIQTHHRWLVHALLERGHIPAILCKDYQPEVSPPMPEGLQLLVYGNSGSTGRQIVRAIRQVRGFRPDVSIVTGYGWVSEIAVWWSQRRSRKVYFEVASGMPYSKRDARKLVSRVFHEVVGQSRRVADTFARSFHWKGPLNTIPAMPEPLEISANIPSAENRVVPLGKAHGALFSRLVPHKRALWLVQQWPRLQKSLGELHIHGGGPEEPLIRQLIESEKWGDRVFCHGRYPVGQGYVDLIRKYDLTLLPTHGEEGAPLVLLESMACGVPFVASGAGGIPDYANPHCAVATLHPDRFLETLESFLERLAHGEIQHQAVQEFYTQNYSYRVLADRWLNYIENGP